MSLVCRSRSAGWTSEAAGWRTACWPESEGPHRLAGRRRSARRSRGDRRIIGGDGGGEIRVRRIHLRLKVVERPISGN